VATYDRDRVVALSRQLAQAHQELRHQLAGIRDHLRDGVSDYPGEQHPAEWQAGNGVLAAHCLAFCSALDAHHQGEDTGMFAALLRQRPELADTVGKLVQDHEMIASILVRVGELADRAAGAETGDRQAIARELDGLGAIMESHFRYEERAIGAALDQGTIDTGWSGQVFGFESAPPDRVSSNSPGASQRLG
jgi:hypothetical protein